MSCKSQLRVLRLVVLLAIALSAPNAAFAESAIDLIAGFDADRVSSCYPISDTAAAGEMSKLLYRLRKSDQDKLAARTSSTFGDANTGDAVKVSGNITAIRQYKVPESLVEFLELENFQELVLASGESGTTISVYVPPLAGRVAKNDAISADAIVINAKGDTPIVAAGRVAWVPSAADNVGWRLLAEEGVDLSQVAEARSRNRRTLEASDAEAFYSMLAAAKSLNQRSSELDRTPPLAIEPVELLQHPEKYHGHWIRMRASTVRITKVTITEPERRKQLGQDHYFQVDASGDLGKYVIRLERDEEGDKAPIEMSGSFPISFVTATLPDFLQAELRANNAVVMMVNRPVSIDGFFYRLWSYTNEFMTREGGGKQVGPLIVVSSWRSLAQPEGEEAEIAYIGYALAAGIFAFIIGTILWTRRNAHEDAKVREMSRKEIKIEL